MDADARAARLNTIGLFIAVGGLLFLTAILLIGFLPLWSAWIADRSTDLWMLDPPVKVTLLQTALAVIGGGWALYLYVSSRTNQTTIAITPTCWLAGTRIGGFLV